MNLSQRPVKWLTSIGGLALGVAVSAGLYVATTQMVENSARMEFAYQSSNAQLAIETRIDDYADVLRGLHALFHTSDRLTRAQFDQYIAALDLHKFPGIRSLNYAQLVTAAEKAAFEAAVRQDRSVASEGYPQFAIRPADARSTYNVLTYVNPMQGFEATFGLDIGSNPRTLKALADSRDSGKLMTSGRLIAVGSGKPQGLAMRIPLYRNGMPQGSVSERRAAYFGSVGAGFNIEKMLEGGLSSDTLRRMRFRLYDTGAIDENREPGTTSPERLLYDSRAGTQSAAQNEHFFSVRTSWEIGGRIWESDFSASKAELLGGFNLHLPWLAALAGLLSSALLFSIFYALTSSRQRAIAIAEGMTKDLRDSQASLEDAQQMAHLGNWLLDPLAGSMSWSAETYRILGYAPHGEHADLSSFLERIHGQDRDHVRSGLQHAVETGAGFSREHRVTHDDGRTRWVQSIAQLGRDGEHKLLRGTIMDITERKQAMLQTDIEHRITQLAASSEEIDAVMPKMIEALCIGFGWSCGVYRIRDENSQRLRCVQYWGRKNIEVTTFLAGQRQLQSPIGSGLAGRAWQTDTPVYVKDLRSELQSDIPDENMTELRCGVAFPVRSDECMYGVIECFGSRLDPLDDGLLRFLQAISHQISQYLQRKAIEDALRYVAAHDSLTKLPNRTLFHQSLRHALIVAARYRTSVAVMFIDIDRFKLVNDTVGHNAGDLVLQECASRLTVCLRDSDIVARLGGDEFAVIIERFDETGDIVTVAKKALATLEQPFLIEGQEFLLAASIGLSVYPEDGGDAETLVKNADAAMYRAKANGNNYQFYSAQMNAHNLARFAMESSLRHAIERNEFLLYYQPKLDLRTNRVSGAEALLRWQHPEMGLVPPMQFIPLAEETGMIIEIGQWVLRTACEQICAWQREGLAPMRIAVNLSPRQFNHKNLLQDITATLAETGLDPALLELEITEGMVMDNPEHAIKILGELKAMGIHLSIDDFGTGYSSLAYLRKLPVDCVKIDRAFIKDIPVEVDDMAISKSIITLGHSLRLRVVAEGVETKEQLQFLRQEHCDEIQGYLFAKPLPTAEASVFLKAHKAEILMLD